MRTVTLEIFGYLKESIILPDEDGYREGSCYAILLTILELKFGASVANHEREFSFNFSLLPKLC